MRFILHSGTPKTGTSSLQVFLDSHRGCLLRHGVLYPDVALYISQPISQPKHQWLIDALMTDNYQQFQANMELCLSQAQEDTHTIILSTEGLFNHWWDISLNAKKALSSMLNRYDVQVVVFFREPLEFAYSRYRQFLVDSLNEKYCYGTHVSFDTALENTWFQNQLKYHEYIVNVEKTLGNGVVVPIKYIPGETITSFLELALQSSELSEYSRGQKTIYSENPSISGQDIHVARIINWLGVKGDKRKIIKYISATGLPRYLLPRAFITDNARRKVMSIAAPALVFLAGKYGISW